MRKLGIPTSLASESTIHCKYIYSLTKFVFLTVLLLYLWQSTTVLNILKVCLHLIPSPSVKIQNMDEKVCLRCKGKTLPGIINKLFFIFKSLLYSNVLPLHLKQTLPPIIWIFNEGEGDGIEFRLPFKIFSTFYTP